MVYITKGLSESVVMKRGLAGDTGMITMELSRASQSLRQALW